MLKKPKEERLNKTKTGNFIILKTLKRKHNYLLLLLLFITKVIIAQNLIAKVSKFTLGTNERFRIQFSFDKQGMDDFTPPNFENFTVVAGPMQSTNFQYINGKQSFEQTYSYTLQPKKQGVYRIKSASAVYKNKRIYSNKVKIIVTKAVKKAANPNDPNLIAKENLFIVAEVSNANPYVGESLYVVYKLYMDPNNAAITNERETKNPEYSGFWNQSIPITKLNERKGTYNGKQMVYYIIRKDVLIPQQTGKLKLAPVEVDVTAVVATGQARRDFFGRIVRDQQRVNITLSSGTRNIHVKEFPIQGKPANFEGAVGDFKFTFKSDKTILKANESAQITIHLSGKGNLKLISLPKIETPASLEQYEPEHKDNITTNLSGMSGYTRSVYTVVPQYKGKYKIPAVSFSYFNPKTAKYVTINTEAIHLDVPEGEMPKENDIHNNKPMVTDNDIRFIKTKTTLQPIAKADDFFQSTLFYLLLLLPMLSIPIGIILGKKKAERHADVVGNKRRKANRLAKKYLSDAKKQLGQKEPFYIALEKALHNYLKAKLHVETSDISKDKISTLLEEKSVNKVLVTKFLKVLNDCDFARYTPTSNLQMEQEYQNAADIILELDKELENS